MPDLPDEVSVASSEAGSESPTAAARGNGSLCSQSAETLAVADAIAKVAEVLSPKDGGDLQALITDRAIRPSCSSAVTVSCGGSCKHGFGSPALQRRTWLHMS